MTMRLSLNDFISKSQAIHGTLYDYSKAIYFNRHTPVIIVCALHGPFEQRPADHWSGSGCKKCSNKYTLTKEEFIIKSQIAHNYKYIYDGVDYINNNVKVQIECKLHGFFEQTPYDHLMGHGCSKCANVSKPTNAEFIILANNIHNNIYDYSTVNYINNKSKIAIICNKHGTFYQTPNRHLQGDGCPRCVHIISRPETEWLDYLGIDLCYRHPPAIIIDHEKIKPDAYNAQTNSIYEFYGDFWHGNPYKFSANELNPIIKKSYGDLYNKTIWKENLIRQKGYKLISIWETDWNLLKSK